MQQLTEALFCGTWRSYKAFLKSGDIKNHSKDKYLEFSFNNTQQLTISAFDNGKHRKLDESKEWTLVLKDKRHYLSIYGKSLEYEIITLNHTALVLMDTKTNEKFYCAQQLTWQTFIKSPSL